MQLRVLGWPQEVNPGPSRNSHVCTGKEVQCGQVNSLTSHKLWPRDDSIQEVQVPHIDSCNEGEETPSWEETGLWPQVSSPMPHILQWWEEVESWPEVESWSNDRWIACKRDDIPNVFRTKFPASVMTIGIMASTGKIMPPSSLMPRRRWLQSSTARSWRSTSFPGWRHKLLGLTSSFSKIQPLPKSQEDA